MAFACVEVMGIFHLNWNSCTLSVTGHKLLVSHFNCCVSGMLNAGIGEKQVNGLLAAMNVPGIHHKALKRREREVSALISSLAKESCDTALENEANEYVH